MSHYALIDENNIVYQVQYFGEDINEQDIIDMYEKQGVTAIKTSYNTYGGEYYGENKNKSPLRKNYAAKGFTYDPIRDAFIESKPYESWILDEEKCIYIPPIPVPEDYKEKNYFWDEEQKKFKIIGEV